MNDTISTIVRSVLKMGGAVLVTKGLSTDAGVETAVGAIVALVGFIWGIIKARKTEAVK